MIAYLAVVATVACLASVGRLWIAWVTYQRELEPTVVLVVEEKVTTETEREQMVREAQAAELVRAAMFRAAKQAELLAQRQQAFADGLDHGADSGCGL
jgi:hypothetical protein